MMIATGGVIINFNLIALPMSEIVGGGSYIANFKISDVAALVIILVEISMGLFLMESLRITHLFPVIGQLDDRMRRKMIWISFTLLFTLAGVESALAFIRDQIASDLQALRQSLSGAEVVALNVTKLRGDIIDLQNWLNPTNPAADTLNNISEILSYCFDVIKLTEMHNSYRPCCTRRWARTALYLL